MATGDREGPDRARGQTGAATVIDLAWTGLAALALLWPSRFIGVLDGAPLDGRVEAIVIGLLLPSLWWVNRPALRANSTRALITALLVWKAGTGVLATQQGLCGRALAAAPLHGVAQGIPIEEPSGALRSWDVRADWRHPTPACTAILTRPMPTLDDFPAWYLNVTDRMLGRRDVTLQAPRPKPAATARSASMATIEPRQVSQIYRLALADLLHDRLASLCQIILLVALFAPLLLLFALKYGIVTTLLDDLASNPETLRLRPIGSYHLKPDFFMMLELRSDVGFVTPATRSIAAQIYLRRDQPENDHPESPTFRCSLPGGETRSAKVESWRI